MAQHGYLREGYGIWGDHDDRERGLRDRDDDRGFMFEDRERFGRDRGDADEWFGGRSREEHRMSRYGREHGFGGFQGDYSGGRDQGGFGGAGDYARGRTSFSSRPDDHYRSWRQRQVEALDRDYADYCREREQQFHRDFDSWRSNRRQGAQSGSAETLELNNPTVQSGESQGSPDPTATATVGTNNSENARTGRTRR